MAAGTEIFRLFGRIMIETSDAERSLSKTESKAKTFLGTIGNGVVTVAKFAGAVGAAALTAAGAATKVAADFQSQMSNVQTLLTGTQDEIAAKVSKYGDIVKEVSRTTGLETSNLTDGLYQVVSAFGDVDDAAKIMEIAAKSAKAGNAETSDAVNLLSAVTKGYGDISAEANQKAADLAFTTVRLGQTSFPELASSMGKVIPLCATMKVSEEELFGAMATLTGVTGGTAEVSTQLKATIQGFMQPTTAMTSAFKKMGYENGQVAIESLGLQGALDALKESVNGDELAFAGMFSSVEAKTAVLALAGAQSEDFTNKTKEMYSATGAAESAFDTQTANLKGTLGKLKQAASTAVIELGEKFHKALDLFICVEVSRFVHDERGHCGSHHAVDFLAALVVQSSFDGKTAAGVFSDSPFHNIQPLSPLCRRGRPALSEQILDGFVGADDFFHLERKFETNVALTREFCVKCRRGRSCAAGDFHFIEPAFFDVVFQRWVYHCVRLFLFYELRSEFSDCTNTIIRLFGIVNMFLRKFGIYF